MICSTEQLVKLLVTMARNKLISAAHGNVGGAAIIGERAGGNDLQQIASREPDPSDKAASKELFERVQGQLSDEEKQLVELRSQGLGWAEIAGQLAARPSPRHAVNARPWTGRRRRGLGRLPGMIPPLEFSHA